VIRFPETRPEREPHGSGPYALFACVTNHLVPWLGADPAAGLVEHTWVYSNSIYVGMEYAGTAGR